MDPARIVVAEDEALIRLDLCEILADEGYEVVGQTGRGDEVIDLVAASEPDLVVLDIKMPGRDGLSVAAELTAGGSVAVLILTAFSQRDLVQQARDAGVMSYLVKPFSREDLVPAIEMAMARFNDLRALGVRSDELEHRLASRKLIDRAKGLLMDRDRISESEAYAMIQKSAMSGRRSMEQIASDLLGENQ